MNHLLSLGLTVLTATTPFNGQTAEQPGFQPSEPRQPVPEQQIPLGPAAVGGVFALGAAALYRGNKKDNAARDEALVGFIAVRADQVFPKLFKLWEEDIPIAMENSIEQLQEKARQAARDILSEIDEVLMDSYDGARGYKIAARVAGGEQLKIPEDNLAQEAFLKAAITAARPYEAEKLSERQQKISDLNKLAER